VTAPLPFDVTPLDGPGLEWLELYGKARATMRTEVVNYDNVAPVRPLRWPWMLRTYDGWELEPEPEPVKARLW
jgi:hypothetical protein